MRSTDGLCIFFLTYLELQARASGGSAVGETWPQNFSPPHSVGSSNVKDLMTSLAPYSGQLGIKGPVVKEKGNDQRFL